MIASLRHRRAAIDFDWDHKLAEMICRRRRLAGKVRKKERERKKNWWWKNWKRWRLPSDLTDLRQIETALAKAASTQTEAHPISAVVVLLAERTDLLMWQTSSVVLLAVVVMMLADKHILLTVSSKQKWVQSQSWRAMVIQNQVQPALTLFFAQKTDSSFSRFWQN